MVKGEAGSPVVLCLFFSLQDLFAFCSVKECLGPVRRTSSGINNGTTLAAAPPEVGGLGCWGQETTDSADEVLLKLFSNEISCLEEDYNTVQLLFPLGTKITLFFSQKIRNPECTEKCIFVTVNKF